MKRGFMVAAAVAAAAGLPAAASAEEGMVVTRDAETGALRAPTAAELATLRAKSGEGAGRNAALNAQPRLRRLANGGIAATVPESLMQYTVVQQRADGTLERQCVQGEEQAKTSPVPAFAERIKTVSQARTVRGMPYEDQ